MSVAGGNNKGENWRVDMIANGRVMELMRMACEKNGLSANFANKVNASWNRNFTSRMGDANWDKMRVRFSVPLFSRASVQEQENTVVHEICHIIAREKYGNGIKSHGGEWKACMYMCGYEPDRTHSVNNKGLYKTRKIYETRCGCSVHMVTSNKFARIARGDKWKCNRCKAHLFIPNTPQKKIVAAATPIVKTKPAIADLPVLRAIVKKV